MSATRAMRQSTSNAAGGCQTTPKGFAFAASRLLHGRLRQDVPLAPVQIQDRPVVSAVLAVMRMGLRMRVRVPVQEQTQQDQVQVSAVGGMAKASMLVTGSTISWSLHRAQQRLGSVRPRRSGGVQIAGFPGTQKTSARGLCELWDTLN